MASVAADFEDEDVVFWFVNVGETAESAYDFIGEGGVTAPCLLDTEAEFYQSYYRPPSSGPYPLDVVVDREGVISHISGNYDADAMRNAIEAALAK